MEIGSVGPHRGPMAVQRERRRVVRHERMVEIGLLLDQVTGHLLSARRALRGVEAKTVKLSDARDEVRVLAEVAGHAYERMALLICEEEVGGDAP